MTINRLNQGTTNQVLVKAISGQTTNLLELQDSSGNVVSSVGPTGLFTGFGKVLQVVHGSTNTEATSTSGTYADTNLSASITPKYNTSNILIFLSQHIYVQSSAAIGQTVLVSPTATLWDSLSMLSTATGVSISGLAIDSPATTSPTIYKTRFRRNDGTGTVVVQKFGTTSRITLVEVAG